MFQDVHDQVQSWQAWAILLGTLPARCLCDPPCGKITQCSTDCPADGRLVGDSEGLKTWATLLAIRDGKIREQVVDQNTGETYDVVPSIKELRQVCQLILSYTWGRPSEMDQDGMLQRVKEMEERLIAYEQARLITAN